MSDLRKKMRESFPCVPGDCIDHIIYQAKVDEASKWRPERDKYRQKVMTLEKQCQRHVENYNYLVKELKKSKAGRQIMEPEYTAPTALEKLIATRASVGAKTWLGDTCDSAITEIECLQARVAELEALEKRMENVATRLNKMEPVDRQLINPVILIKDIMRSTR